MWQAFVTLAILSHPSEWYFAWIAVAITSAAVFVPILLCKKSVLGHIWRCIVPAKEGAARVTRLDGYSENERYGIVASGEASYLAQHQERAKPELIGTVRMNAAV